jgi:hypothetical protein
MAPTVGEFEIIGPTRIADGTSSIFAQFWPRIHSFCKTLKILPPLSIARLRKSKLWEQHDRRDQGSLDVLRRIAGEHSPTHDEGVGEAMLLSSL